MTLCISDIDTNKKRASKTAFIYLLLSLFCCLFSAVYERYSHEVYSYYMIYAFVFPLIGGTLPFNILNLINVKNYPNALARNLYNSGIATLTIGSIIQGILEIYGTTNEFVNYYWKAGFLLSAGGIVAFIFMLIKRRFKNRKTL